MIARHSSPQTFITSDIITSDVHHLRCSSPQTFITPYLKSDVHHLRRLILARGWWMVLSRTRKFTTFDSKIVRDSPEWTFRCLDTKKSFDFDGIISYSYKIAFWWSLRLNTSLICVHHKQKAMEQWKPNYENAKCHLGLYGGSICPNESLCYLRKELI